MCRTIKQLRSSEIEPTDQEIQEAALQFVRKVSGYRKPSKANEAAFNQAVIKIAASTRELLDNLVVGKETAHLQHVH
ncbi:MAG TPA: DUF2277 domain-containing protein [Anaerolineae bacterium]|nr:DUF2277 domain-containing protein [Anaerolineae bacterium]